MKSTGLLYIGTCGAGMLPPRAALDGQALDPNPALHAITDFARRLRVRRGTR